MLRLSDFTRVPRARSLTYESQVAFLLAELNCALTLAQMAQTTTDPSLAAQFVTDAEKSCTTVVHLYSHTGPYEDGHRRTISERLTALQQLLAGVSEKTRS